LTSSHRIWSHEKRLLAAAWLKSRVTTASLRALWPRTEPFINEAILDFAAFLDAGLSEAFGARWAARRASADDYR
jgi:hypothetical protein